MKIKFIAIASLLILSVSCSNKDVQNSLNDPEKQGKILNSISTNRDLLKKLAVKFQQNNPGQKMIIGNDTTMMNVCMNMMNNSEMIGMMMHNPDVKNQLMNQVMLECERDTTLCVSMCHQVMNSPKMMHMMSIKRK